MYVGFGGGHIWIVSLRVLPPLHRHLSMILFLCSDSWPRDQRHILVGFTGREIARMDDI